MESPHHSSPTFINIFFLFLFAIVIGVVSSIGTYVFMKSQSSEQSSIPMMLPYQNTQTTTTPQPTYPPSSAIQTTQTVIDETANWKVYRNKKYGYEIKYPQNWVVSTRSDNPSDKSIYIYSTEPIWQQSSESISYGFYIEHLNDLQQGDRFDEKAFTYDRTQINGFDVYRTTDKPSRLGAEYNYIFAPDGTYVLILFAPYEDKYTPLPEQERFYTMFNQMLSTFKFLE